MDSARSFDRKSVVVAVVVVVCVVVGAVVVAVAAVSRHMQILSHEE